MCAILNNQVQMISKPVWPVWPCFLIGSQPSLLFFLYTRDLEEPRRKELVTREQLESFTSPVTIHNTKKTLWGDRSFNRLEQISQRHSPDSFQLVQQIYLSQHRRKRAFSAVSSPIHSSGNWPLCSLNTREHTYNWRLQRYLLHHRVWIDYRFF